MRPCLSAVSLHCLFTTLACLLNSFSFRTLSCLPAVWIPPVHTSSSILVIIWRTDDNIILGSAVSRQWRWAFFWQFMCQCSAWHRISVFIRVSVVRKPTLSTLSLTFMSFTKFIFVSIYYKDLKQTVCVFDFAESAAEGRDRENSGFLSARITVRYGSPVQTHTVSSMVTHFSHLYPVCSNPPDTALES